eukprot:TRINITY_DN3193_c0_g2_i3.p1 TRINITY_DN3193_c0_g2~~TRINITY_DN3193_c0_g2_i3.p1  ORF type:complete len:569 (+),score=208.34 TRINITY_DN3193_c0_g2_i3:50-1756(+)
MLFLPSFATKDDFVAENKGQEAKLTMNPDVVAAVVVAVSTWRSLCEKLVAEYDSRCQDFYEPAYGKAEKDISGEIALWKQNVTETEMLGQLQADRVVLLMDVVRASGDAQGLKELDQLEKHMETLEGYRDRAVIANNHLSLFTPYLACLETVKARDKPLDEVTDLLQPLFSTLRVAWSCTELYPDNSIGTRRFWDMLGSVFRNIAECVRRHLRTVPKRIGNEYVRVDKSRPNESLREQQELKGVVLSVLDVTTAVKEAYYKTRVYLEECMGRVWDFSTKWEEVLFEDLDFLYEKGMEILTCLDTCYEHYTTQQEMKKKNAEQGGKYNTALLTATLNDITASLNDLTFDLTLKEHYMLWDEALVAFRQHSERLKHLEETGGMHSHTSLSAPDDRIKDLYPAEAVGGFTPIASHGMKAMTEPSPTLFIVTTFNPPEVFIYGPVREGTIDVLNVNIPAAFSTATSKVMFGRQVPPIFVKKSVKDEALNYTGVHNDFGVGGHYWHLAAHSQFCDEVGQSYLASIILDTLEKEARWVLRDTNATYLPLSGDSGQKVHYKYFFQKRDKHIDEGV